MEKSDEYFMRLALDEARAAGERGETPIGAVIVRDGEVVSSAGNARERDKNALAHAETAAISKACEVLGGWRLVGCTLYVTLEPCPMCAGAIMNARVPRVVYGARDEKGGAIGGLFNLFDEAVNHKPEITGGVLGEECARMLRDFFRERRAGGGFDPAKEWKERHGR